MSRKKLFLHLFSSLNRKIHSEFKFLSFLLLSIPPKTHRIRTHTKEMKLTKTTTVCLYTVTSGLVEINSYVRAFHPYTSFLPPPLMANLVSLSCRFTSLLSSYGAVADILIKAALNHLYATSSNWPLRVTGAGIRGCALGRVKSVWA